MEQNKLLNKLGNKKLSNRKINSEIILPEQRIVAFENPKIFSKRQSLPLETIYESEFDSDSNKFVENPEEVPQKKVFGFKISSKKQSSSKENQKLSKEEQNENLKRLKNSKKKYNNRNSSKSKQIQEVDECFFNDQNQSNIMRDAASNSLMQFVYENVLLLNNFDNFLRNVKNVDSYQFLQEPFKSNNIQKVKKQVMENGGQSQIDKMVVILDNFEIVDQHSLPSTNFKVNKNIKKNEKNDVRETESKIKKFSILANLSDFSGTITADMFLESLKLDKEQYLLENKQYLQEESEYYVIDRLDNQDRSILLVQDCILILKNVNICVDENLYTESNVLKYNVYISDQNLEKIIF